MEDYISISKNNLLTAKKIIKDLKILEILNENDCIANLIGSTATDLLMYNLDIDFHIYPNIFCIENIYKIIGKLSENVNVLETNCKHIDLNSEFKTLDWHLHYKDSEDNIWKIDLIFLKPDSPYKDKAENIVKKINSIKTFEQKNDILRLKHELKVNGIEYKGIEIYKAVFENNIKTIDEFKIWKSSKYCINIDLWDITIKL